MPGYKKYRGVDKDGLEVWTFTVYYGKQPDGKPKRHYEQFHGLPNEVDGAQALFYARVVQEEKRRAATPLTIAQWAEQYLVICAGKGLAGRTIAGYRQHLENRLLPALGKLPLAKLTPNHIKQFMAMLDQETIGGPRGKNRVGEPISGATKLSHYRTLSGMLQEAVYQELIPDNPARAVRPPRVKRHRAKFADGDVIDHILIAMLQQTPRNYGLWMLALGLGLRRGELAALRWENVDWRNNTLTIAGSVDYVPHDGEHLKDPKSDAGYRVLYMPGPVREALECVLVQQWLDRRACQQRLDRAAVPRRRYKHRTRPHSATPRKSPKSWQNTGHVFTINTGKRVHVDTISTLYQRFQADYALPDINLHALRHTAITIWLSGGSTLTDAASLAGHDPATTARHYAHALTQHLRHAAITMGHFIATKLTTKQRDTR